MSYDYKFIISIAFDALVKTNKLFLIGGKLNPVVNNMHNEAHYSIIYLFSFGQASVATGHNSE